MVRHRLRGRPHLCEQRGKLRAADRRQAKPDPFDHGVEVGRGEQPDAQPGTVQNRCDHGRGGALAVGAGDVDGGNCQVRVPQLLQQEPHAWHTAAPALRLAAAQVGKAHEAFEGRLVGSVLAHDATVTGAESRVKAMAANRGPQ